MYSLNNSNKSVLEFHKTYMHPMSFSKPDALVKGMQISDWPVWAVGPRLELGAGRGQLPFLSPCSLGGRRDFLKEIGVLLPKEGRLEMGG